MSAIFDLQAQWVREHGAFLKRMLSASMQGELYGLYKQSTLGDNDQPQAWAVQLEARAKWDAWNACQGMDPAAAKEKYIEKVDQLKKLYKAEKKSANASK